jgi:hypothetical protein
MPFVAASTQKRRNYSIMGRLGAHSAVHNKFIAAFLALFTPF